MNESLFLTAQAVPLLQDVERAYSIKPNAEFVTEVWENSKLDPKQVFRSHEARKDDVVEEPDVSYRVALDLLFGGLSALHTGGLGATENRQHSEPGKSAIRRLLEQNAVRKYTEKHYPYAPPILVRLSISGELPEIYRQAWAKELADERFEASYRRFLHLDARFIANDVIGEFIELLDDFFVRGDHLSDLCWALGSPKRLNRWVNEAEHRWQLLEGMESFFQIGHDLDALLRDVDLPVLRGHIWLHFAYWFGSGGKRMVQVAKWLADAARTVEGRESDETAAALIQALERLRDPNDYPAEVLQLGGDRLEPWLRSSGVGRRLKAAQ